jgi:DNA-binding response OmpR family regulator
MDPHSSRPPTKVLIVHDGSSVDHYVTYFTEAGLTVTDAHADEAVSTAGTLQPDIIVLDFDCDGETLAELKDNAGTRAIPVIALADLDRLKG